MDFAGCQVFEGELKVSPSKSGVIRERYAPQYPVFSVKGKPASSGSEVQNTSILDKLIEKFDKLELIGAWSVGMVLTSEDGKGKVVSGGEARTKHIVGN
ncbi:hypothetical protein Forpe1208_v014240 [Fusarium oxysporum f. sp. rapae]|uniref:Uncharacterized protein n=1 Tax=Fusarium oxysporum f. sp. rapae TaxID=485398 RepID=A0A8J5NSU8_FUSOX|nr:hypothetical protein Forpe1208_v014240 [Fusarium oxysporum f. sp. rapae]